MMMDNHFSIFIITYKFRLAAAAAIIGGVRCHHWQRPLPIMSPPAANLKSMPLFPLRCLPLPVCRALSPLDAPLFARHQQCSPACRHFFSEWFADSVNNSCLSSKEKWNFQKSCPRSIAIIIIDDVNPAILGALRALGYFVMAPFKVTYGRMRMIIFVFYITQTNFLYK